MNEIHNHIQGKFTIIPNGLIEDISLSDRARFLYIVLSQKPQNWIFYTKQLCNSLGMHPDTFRKYRDELCDSGWLLVEEQKIKDGKFKSRIYHLNSYPTPINNRDLFKTNNEQKERIFPTQKNTDTENIRHGKTQSLNNTNTRTINTNRKNNNKFSKETKDSSFQNPNPR